MKSVVSITTRDTTISHPKSGSHLWFYNDEAFLTTHTCDRFIQTVPFLKEL